MGAHRKKLPHQHSAQHPRKGKPGTKAVVVRQAGMIPVSDHALIRFLERVGGMDVESIRMSMQMGLSRAATVARGMGDANFVIKIDGNQYVVRDDIVTTVLPGTKHNVLGRPQFSDDQAGHDQDGGN